MVLQKKLEYGFYGYQVPATPRAARSVRRNAFKKNGINHQISSFDLLVAVAGNFLLDDRHSSSSSNNASDGGCNRSERNDKELTFGGLNEEVKLLRDNDHPHKDLDLKPGYSGRRNYFRSLRSERKYPIKKRRYFDCYKSSQPEETVKKGVRCGSRQKDITVKLRIKSFRVHELFIEIPETATVGSLKRTVLEAVNVLLGGGLRVGVLVHGKKVRDDDKMLFQTGFSLDTLSDALGFCLEPNPSHSQKPIRPNEFNSLLHRNIPQPVTRYHRDHDYEPSSSKAKAGKTKSEYARALVPVPPLHIEAITLIPQRKLKRCEVAQRRIGRPFLVAELEAFVQAVEKLGTGRWRDVKLQAFDNAEQRRYVDLKDKWKTLVHTARISPHQRRGEAVPQELLDRVLTAHAVWSQHQEKHHHQQLLSLGPETSLRI